MTKAILVWMFVAACIPGFAQQKEVSDEASRRTPCFPFGLIDPASQTICIGSSAVFRAGAYQVHGIWEMSIDSGVTWGPSIGNASFPDNYDALTIPAVTQNMSGYLFRCSYTAYCEGEITMAARLTASNIPARINTQPADVSICKSYPARFSVAVTGGSITYQWQVSMGGINDFINIPGKNASVLNFDSVNMPMNGNHYRCLISSECSPVQFSDAVLLTVKDEMNAITLQPTNQLVCAADTGTLSLTAIGNNLTYQWQQAWYPNSVYENIPGANGPTLVSANAEWNKRFRCIVAGNCSTLYSYEVHLNTITRPVPTAAAQKYVCNGEQVFLQAWDVAYQQEQLYQYQWQVSHDSGLTFTNVETAGESFSLLVIANQSNNNLIYRCHINNHCFNAYSNHHTVKANLPVLITKQPKNNNACIGFSTAFSLTTTGSATGYQWQVSQDAGNNFSNLTTGGYGMLTPELTLTNVNQELHDNLYRCKISSNCFETVYSDTAVLHVFENPIAPGDAAMEVSCDSCKANIASLFNNANYPATSWGDVDSLNARAGKYSFKVFNAAGCFDSAFAFVNVHEADTMNICRNSIASFHTSLTGNTYQWQMNTGAGFVDIPESAGATGTNATDLTLYNAGAMQVRCKIDGSNYSSTTFVKITAYWTGKADSNWYNPVNWSCGDIPYYFLNDTYVIIMPNTPHLPVLDNNAGCKRLILKPGTRITITPGYNLFISGGN